MPRKRNPENLGLPDGWRVLHGAYYYSVPKGQEQHWDGKKLFRLGKKPSEAYKEWEERTEIQTANTLTTIGHILDRYLLEEVPKLSPRFQVQARNYIKALKPVFGHMRKKRIKPTHCYQYIDKSQCKGQARRHIKLLSAALSSAVQWGTLEENPIFEKVRVKDKRTHAEKKMDNKQKKKRYIEDWEMAEYLSIKPKHERDSIIWQQAYVELKSIIALRKSDMLLIETKNILDIGLKVSISKNGGEEVLFLWTDKLRAAVNKALKARPVDISPFLFCNRQGKSYVHPVKETTSGFDTTWQRNMVERVLKETKITQRFKEHDIRAKVSSDMASDEEAKELLAHADVRTTKEFYRRKIKVIRTQV